MSGTKVISPPAPIAVQPQPRVPVPGSAESISSLLTGRGFCCPHFPKYHVGSSPDLGQYPSRLAFFHATGKDTGISFLDTNKLCSKCLNLAVPDGFNYWSTSVTVRDLRASDSPASQTTPSLPPRWLDMATSSDSYPRLFQAGTEGFPQNTLDARHIASHCVAPPATVHIPQLPGAKEAWLWLQDQRKPFYIDQLHLNKGWSPFGEMMAYNDSAIAEKTGVAFNLASQTTERKTKRARKAPLQGGKGPVSDVTAGDKDGDASETVKRGKDIPSLEDTITVTAATPDPSATPTGTTRQASKHVQEEKGKRSVSTKSAKKSSHTRAVIPVVEKSGGTSAAASSARSTKKSSSTARPIIDLNKKIAPKTSSAAELLKERAESQALPCNPTETAEPIGVKIADKKTVKAKVPSKTSQNFMHTKNWSQPDPIPFDSPIMTLKLDDYKRRATVTDPKVSLSKSPLKQFLKKDKIKDDNVSFSGPESSSRTPAVTSFIEMTTKGESSAPMATSEFIASIVQGTPSAVSREAKPRITKTPKSQLPKTEHPGNEPSSMKSLGGKLEKILDKRAENKVDNHVRYRDPGRASHIDRPRRKHHSRSTSPAAKPKKPHGERPTYLPHEEHGSGGNSATEKPKKPHGERPTHPPHGEHGSGDTSPENPAPKNPTENSEPTAEVSETPVSETRDTEQKSRENPTSGKPTENQEPPLEAPQPPASNTGDGEQERPESLTPGKRTEIQEPTPEVSRTAAASNTGDTEHKPPNRVPSNTTTTNGPEGKTGATAGLAVSPMLDDEHAPSKHRPDSSPASSALSMPVNSELPSRTGTPLLRGSAEASEEGGSDYLKGIPGDYEGSDNGDVDNDCGSIDETYGAGQGHLSDNSEHRRYEDSLKASDDDNEHANAEETDEPSDIYSMNGDGYDLSEDDPETSDGGQPEPSSQIQASGDESDGEQDMDDAVRGQDSHNDNYESGTESDEEFEPDDDDEQVENTEEEEQDSHNDSDESGTESDEESEPDNDKEQVGDTEEEEQDNHDDNYESATQSDEESEPDDGEQQVGDTEEDDNNDDGDSGEDSTSDEDW
ncbi:hypothetical protein DL768_008683 [Monosporascus sp. mg162]|nr:hypothetical protein DL768_008683 [Monosporascus sp. mg162]